MPFESPGRKTSLSSLVNTTVGHDLLLPSTPEIIALQGMEDRIADTAILLKCSR